ncbi:MAG: MFS transporter [Solirubrobacterales bacterium]
MGDSPERDRSLHTGAVLAAVSMGIFVVQLDFFALNLALPDMADELDTSTTDLQWVISGYMLALAASLIPSGRLGDLLGRKRVMIAGVLIFGATSLAGGIAPGPEVLIAFRIVQGIGAAIIFSVGIALLSNSFPADRQMRAIGNAYGLGATATAVGPFIGGALTEWLDWRAVLLVNVPVTLVAAWLTWRYVSESRDEKASGSIDLPGVALVALGIAAITLAVDRADLWGFLSADTLGLLALGLLLLGGFVARERSAREPLVDLSLFSNHPYVGITLLGTVANVAFVVTTFAVTIYLQQVEGYSALEAGLIFIAASLALGVAGPASGRLGERFYVPSVMTVGTLAGAIGLFVIAMQPSLGPFLVALVIFGGGYGIGWSMATIGTQAVVAKERAGEASGVTLAIVIGLAGLAVAFAGTVIDETGADASALGDSIATMSLAVAIGSVGLSLLLIAWIRRSESRVEAAPAET